MKLEIDGFAQKNQSKMNTDLCMLRNLSESNISHIRTQTRTFTSSFGFVYYLYKYFDEMSGRLCYRNVPSLLLSATISRLLSFLLLLSSRLRGVGDRQGKSPRDYSDQICGTPEPTLQVLPPRVSPHHHTSPEKKVKKTYRIKNSLCLLLQRSWEFLKESSFHP